MRPAPPISQPVPWHAGPQWLVHAIREAFTGPFQPPSAFVRDLTVAQLEQQRRALILRLTLTFVLLSLVVVALPVSFLSAQQPTVYGVFLALILCSVVGLLANQRGYTTFAASMFLTGAFAVTVGYSATQSAAGLTAVINYATLGIFLLLAGLTLPSALLWVTAALAAFLTTGGLLFFPFAPHLRSLAGGVTVVGLVPEIISF